MWIEWLIQFGPVTLFFLVYELAGKNFFAATTALMFATIIALLAYFLRNHRLALFPLFSASFILVFGGATLYFRDPQFLIVKDTLYDAIFGMALLWSLRSGKNLMRAFFNTLIAMSDRGWHLLALRWAIFFLTSAALNEMVRHTFPPEIWVHYKFANTIVLIVFGLYQFTLIHRERLAGDSNGLGLRIRKAPFPLP